MPTSARGVATGRAWTPVGGDVRFIEATDVAGALVPAISDVWQGTKAIEIDG